MSLPNKILTHRYPAYRGEVHEALKVLHMPLRIASGTTVQFTEEQIAEFSREVREDFFAGWRARKLGAEGAEEAAEQYVLAAAVELLIAPRPLFSHGGSRVAPEHLETFLGLVARRVSESFRALF